MIDLSIVTQYWPSILQGMAKTLQIAFFSCLLGTFGGTVLGLGQAYGPKILQWFIGLLTGIIKGTPMLVQITFAFFLLPQIGIHMSAFWTAVVAIGINSSSYLSSIILAGIQAVSIGQLEAAYVLGFSKIQTVRYIVLPQAFSIILPALGNELITLVKDSSLASVIGVMELAKEAAVIRSRTYDVITTYTIIALLYLLLTGSIALLMRYVTKRMRHAGN